MHGVDVSSHQPGWTPAAADAYVFVKASEGTTYRNPYRAKQVAAARAKGLVVGWYAFVHPDHAKDQAAYFVASLDLKPGDLLVCDWENTGDGHPSVADAATFIAEVKRLTPGHRVGLYCNQSDWLTTAVKPGDFLWIARYGDSLDAQVTGWTFWQYSDRPIDQNRSRFTTAAQLKTWAAGAAPQPKPSAPVPSTTKEPTVKTERIPFRGGLTCSCVVESLPWVELDMLMQGLIAESINCYQFGYRTDVAASAGTHSGGGNTDVGQFSDAQIRVWRKWGWTIQHRTKAQGFDMDHGHGWPLGCPHLSAGGRDQAAQWARRQNGLASHGPIAGPYTTTTWKTALKENKMAILDEITDAVIAGIKRDGTVNVEQSVLTGNAKNKTVAVHTALDYIGRKLMTLVSGQAALTKKVDALAAKVGK